MQSHICDLPAFCAISEIFLEKKVELIFHGISFREFDYFKRFRGINIRKIEARKFAKINSANT